MATLGIETEGFLQTARAGGCPIDQMENFLRARIYLQPRQLLASAAARQCDLPGGPTSVGYGGARGGGKSHWLLAQIAADDCQRVRGLKCLLLRKVGKANTEHFEDLRRRLFQWLPHEFAAYRGMLTFANGSRIVTGHFQNERDIDAYLGLEYDVIGIEEATTLTHRKHQDIATCCRSSKVLPNGETWRPRIYSTTNPGGIGHAWYKRMFVDPYHERLRSRQTDPAFNFQLSQPSTINHQPSTVFVPARVDDNRYNNPDYRKVLEALSGWQRRAWLEGDWDIAAGQFFTTFRRDVHVVRSFDDWRAVEWFAALDYGFTHYTVCLLGCKDGDGNTFIVDEHAERMWLPERHAKAIRDMLARHHVPTGDFGWKTTREQENTRPLALRDLRRFVAGADVFSRQSDGATIADQYLREGVRLRCASTDRVNGWAEVLRGLGDVDAGIAPKLFIHSRCARLLETLPALQHDPSRPEDVLKVDTDEDGLGGDDAADCLRYLVATKPRIVYVRRLTGL